MGGEGRGRYRGWPGGCAVDLGGRIAAWADGVGGAVVDGSGGRYASQEEERGWGKMLCSHTKWLRDVICDGDGIEDECAVVILNECRR